MIRMWLLSLLFMILTCQASGQVHHSRHYTIRDGLPSNKVRAVFKDSRDILWVGTDAGLCTFDGRKFNLVSLPDHVTTKKVWAITEDPSGNMWFGTHGSGLLKYDGREFTSITTPQLTSDYIRVLKYSVRFGCLLVGTQYGFNSIAEDGIFTYDRDSIIDNRFLVMSFLETRDGIIFHTFSDYAYHFNPLTKEVKPLPKESPLNVRSSSASFITSRGDTIIGLAKTGLRIIGKNGLRDYHNIGQVFDIKEDTNGKIWIAAWSYYDMKEPGGIYTFDGNELRYENPVLGITGRLMWNFFMDPDTETTFLTTEGEGMYKLINKGISRYPASFFGAERLEIYDMKLFRNNLWITAHDRVIYGNENNGFRFLNENWFMQRQLFPEREYTNLINQPHGIFRAMTIDMNQNLWIGSNNSLYKLTSDEPNFLRFSISPRTTENFIFSPDGKLFSEAESYFRITPNIYVSPNRVSINDNKQFPSSLSRIITRKNEIWFSSFYHGLYRYKNDQFKWFGNQNPELPQNLSTICLDASNNIVIGTTDGRVLILEGSDSLTVSYELSGQTGITGNEILWLLNDSKNRLWIGTNMGLNIVNLDQLYQSGHAEIHYINESEGYLEYSIRAAIQDEKGIIWLGGQNNLVRIDPEKLLQTPANIERIGLTGLEINFRQVHWDSITEANPWRNVPTGKVTLGHRQNNLTFSYTVDNLLNPDKLMYSHFLEGFFNEPAEYTNTSEVTFTNLPPGRYTLVVNAYNMQSRFRYQPLEFHFRILPPWWQTWYFYSALSILILLTAFLVMQYRVRQVKQTEHLKLENEKRLNSIRIQAAQAQMNPHFVFNVLSSIQSFMLDNDMDSTLEYLNDFSSLIRKTMENISAETILLSDEIAYLKRYIKLESLRLGNDLTSKISIDSSLSKRELRIPPMIIQPFVENAIKHGLAPSPENRILYLSFRLEDNTLRIMICDNGIGMRSSAQYNRSGAYHQSKGIKNTTERILYYTQSLNGGIHSDYGVKISDRKRNGNIIGVKVEISLPVMD